MNEIEKNGLYIVEKLRNLGFKAYYAGGYVRDIILGRTSGDIDIATNATPDEIVKIFPKSLEIGKQFGVVIVIKNKIKYEIATFRKDNVYLDGRRPQSVTFCDEKEDVARRDFTINGLLYDPINSKIIDYVGGESDIKNKLIRTIGDPEARFKEDKLRMIRAVRFAVRFGFLIEASTEKAIRQHSKEIINVSFERLHDELVKVLTGPNAGEGLKLLDKTGLLSVILPEVVQMKGVIQEKEFHPEGDVFTHTILMLNMANNPSNTLALGILLHDIGKPITQEFKDRIRFNCHDEKGAEIAKDILNRFRFSNQDCAQILSLIKNHMRFKEAPKMRLGKLKNFLGLSNFEEHLELHRLDCLASHKNLDVYNFCKEKLASLTKEEIKPDPLITGYDLIDLGFKPSPLFKKIITLVYEAQLEGTIKDKKEASEFIKKLPNI
jgi:poly(A) polymerase